MRTTLIFASGIAAAVVAACAATAPGARGPGSANRQCFLASQVNNFWGATDTSVFVRVGVNDVYQLQLSGMCQDIDWANRIALRSTGGGSWVCHGLDAEILIPSTIGTQRCLVTDVRKLSPDEAKAARGR
jgi:hypothetical protein